MDMKDPMSYGYANFNRLVQESQEIKNRIEVEEQLAEYIKERELAHYFHEEELYQGKCDKLDGYIEALQWVLKEENA